MIADGRPLRQFKSRITDEFAEKATEITEIAEGGNPPHPR
jgi:hypothetical protein